MTDTPRPTLDELPPEPSDELPPTLAELPLDLSDEVDEHEYAESLEQHYREGVDVAVVWTPDAMDHWAWLWGLIDGTKIGVKVLVAGRKFWHGSKFSTVNGSRATPRPEFDISINPLDWYAGPVDPNDPTGRRRLEAWPCQLAEAPPIKSAFKKRVVTAFCAIVSSVLLATLFLPIESHEIRAAIGFEHGVLLALWLCTFYGWRISGPVSYAKFVLQMRAPWVLTPGGLYKELKRRDETPGA